MNPARASFLNAGLQKILWLRFRAGVWCGHQIELEGIL